MKSLVGKYLIHDDGEAFRTGKVMDATDTAVLIQFDMMKRTANDPIDVNFGMMLVAIERIMHEVDGDGYHSWTFFDSRDRLDAFLKWMNGDGDKANTVVRLVTPKPTKKGGKS